MPRLPGVRPLVRLPGAERDVRAAVDDELAFHIEMATAELVASGQPPDAARRAAEARFGNLDRVRQDCVTISTRHDTAMRRSESLASLGQDIVYAVRSARRAPGFSLVVLLTLALGIGATTAMFSVVRGVLLRPLPFPDAAQVVRIWPANRAAEQERGQVSSTELEDWERELRGFTAVGAFRTFSNGSVYGEPGAEPAYVPTAFVSRGFFPALGAGAALGRTFTADEHVAGRNRSVVVSDGFWRSRLGADPRAVGRTLRLDDKPYTVVGVMPAGFAFPAPDVAVWLSSSLLGPEDVGDGRGARWLDLVARLRPGTTAAQGRAQVEALLARLAAAHPESNAGWTAANVEDVRDSIVGRVRRGLLVLLGAVGLVLLVVCANVANLILVRGTARERELAVRAAIGASRRRIVRQLLTESVLLALVGGALGVLAAWWGVRTLVALGGDFLPRAADVRLDGPVLAFALALSALTGVLFGVWPALRASAGTRLSATLRENARGSVGAGASHRARAVLVTAEMALAVMLVVGAGLMLRSFQRLTAADPGFRAEEVLLARFSIDDDQAGTQAERLALRQRVLDRVRVIPGVTAAGATKDAPLADEWGEGVPFAVPGRPAPAPGAEPHVQLQPASPGYFKAMGIPLLAGEDHGPPSAGDSTAGMVAVISRQMAEQVWPGETPIGRTFEIFETPVRVIGVVGDVRTARLDSIGGFTAYLAERNMTRSSMSLLVRTTGDPARLVAPVRAAVREVLPGQAFREITPLRAKLSESVATPRFFTGLVTLFGALALALAAVGLYGVVSYVVRQREREIGVRLALGAPPARVLTLMLGQGMKPVLVGLVLGLAAAAAGGRVLAALLYEVHTIDPVTFAVVPVLFAAVALLAALVPSWRAARVHPAVTLRAD